ncbi:GtrA family protein [Salinispora arenicola]|uniref:GtrA family protein n=1 Tax=Salinispora arenicola TaxID=168697 RepID=UPI000370D2CA|nr:GtrA family protein [Salinispora arenicola]MCN0180609.1 GtrA family protein [Salinispora arenicola]NIL40544.1 GtrA family protein [Salinispora arenicola]NIL59064.1 GtrA family protein [Salinispora arenicola]NIL61898.1 GtrA family protein [Salinispora arenicola]
MKNCTRYGRAAASRANTRFHAQFHANLVVNIRTAATSGTPIAIGLAPEPNAAGDPPGLLRSVYHHRPDQPCRPVLPVLRARTRYARPVAATMTGEPGSRQTRPGLIRSLLDRFGHLVHELSKFATVGGVAFLVDFALFNVMTAVQDVEQVTAKTISTVVAATFAFLGNRFWTWRHRRGGNPAREYALFFFFNAVGLGITVAVLAISRYGLGQVWPEVFQTPLADNIASYLVGTGLATLFRFWSYRRFVFVPAGTPAVPEAKHDRHRA